MDKTIYEKPLLEVVSIEFGDVLTDSDPEHYGGDEP